MNADFDQQVFFNPRSSAFIGGQPFCLYQQSLLYEPRPRGAVSANIHGVFDKLTLTFVLATGAASGPITIVTLPRTPVGTRALIWYTPATSNAAGPA
jgi:hypothetical protein